MPDKRSHRGPHPEDSRLFGESWLPILREAARQYVWLLDQGYPPKATLKLVGDRHRLTQRQRVALARSTCTRGQFDRRMSHRVDLDRMSGKPLLLDGYNVLTSVEAALGRGVVLVARDSCYRDMASMHGTYRRVEETEPAVEAIGHFLSENCIAPARWFLDRPVSNSGRLADLMRQWAQRNGWSWEIELVADPDAVLAVATETVATADSGILDRCGSWLNLARLVIERHVAGAWLVDFVAS